MAVDGEVEGCRVTAPFASPSPGAEHPAPVYAAHRRGDEMPERGGGDRRMSARMTDADHLLDEHISSVEQREATRREQLAIESAAADADALEHDQPTLGATEAHKVRMEAQFTARDRRMIRYMLGINGESD